jgi:metal-responsive CopG/Arc/MetJ family transcriptional regulator
MSKQTQQRTAKRPERYIVGVPLQTETVDEIDAMAEAEQRPRAQLVRILILDSLRRRRQLQTA